MGAFLSRSELIQESGITAWRVVPGLGTGGGKSLIGEFFSQMMEAAAKIRRLKNFFAQGGGEQIPRLHTPTA